MKKTPLIPAHRGLVTEYQENTLPAIQSALDNPYCDGTEFDVFLTKDNKVVLLPDDKKAIYGKEVKRLAELQVDWIETDQPELVWKDLHA